VLLEVVVLYFVALVQILALDFLWLGVVMSKTYKSELSSFLRFKADGRTDPIRWAAVMVYLLIPAGLVAFVLPRVDEDFWVSGSIGWGFLFGVILYGVYDFTNYSLIKKWPLKITLIDIAWGGVLCSFVSWATTLISFRFESP
jgi:uncharacterized membrane protein